MSFSIEPCLLFFSLLTWMHAFGLIDTFTCEYSECANGCHSSVSWFITLCSCCRNAKNSANSARVTERYCGDWRTNRFDTSFTVQKERLRVLRRGVRGLDVVVHHLVHQQQDEGEARRVRQHQQRQREDALHATLAAHVVPAVLEVLEHGAEAGRVQRDGCEAV